MDAIRDTLLDAQAISKTFGTTCALVGADLTVCAGQVHALLGENGAGKSTLVKILVGALRPDGGTLTLRNAPVLFDSVRDVIKLGVIPVYQHSTLFPELTVAENFHAFDLAKDKPLNFRKTELLLSTYLETAERIGLRLNPKQRVGSLSMAERQLLEIARGVARDCDVLILDEPTAALNASEAERLFMAIENLRLAGKGIVFIGHKLDEIARICDCVTVLRDGKTVLKGVPTASLKNSQIVEAMVGTVAARPVRNYPSVGAIRLKVSDLGSDQAFEKLSMSVGRGQIIGVAGLIGSGALEVGEVLGGARIGTRGTVHLDGEKLPLNSRRQFKEAGIGLVPADRTTEGVFPGLSCATNAVASSYKTVACNGFVSSRREVQSSRKLFERLRVRPNDPRLPINLLSGGNQQKVLIIRNLLLPNLRVLVVIEPTRGVDVHAREAIHDALVEAATQGVSVIVASSDIDEVLALSHQTYVMRRGRLAKVFQRGANVHQVLACITGATINHEESNHAFA